MKINLNVESTNELESTNDKIEIVEIQNEFQRYSNAINAILKIESITRDQTGFGYILVVSGEIEDFTKYFCVETIDEIRDLSLYGDFEIVSE